MHDHHINDMVKELKEAGLVMSGKTTEDYKKVLEKYWENRIAVVWQAEDVVAKAKEKGIDINDEQVCEVLETVLIEHDASLGICWDNIDIAIDDVVDLS